ncbi:hypothetical protein BDQ12DRAFT_604088 [Crucibulum laeve]|uniref:Uncharacterized protein n=1 Tax=Crucibulum laeve TaxID=68775 RepID=A0A5C3M306_9AGAR|nr:hypothetical protein BDQ12DRAFT_604088 [Crucibulum laeve]
MDSLVSQISSSTPSCQRSALCLEADPALFTPSKCIWTLYAAISSTSSGSCLIAKAKLTSATQVTAPVLKALPPLPQPDWSLAKQISAHQTNQELQCENERLHVHLEQASVINWAQESIIEGAHATLVIQNLHLLKLNSALHGKEKERGPNHTLVIDLSKSQVFSSAAVLEGLWAQEERKKAEEAQKKAKADVRAAKKEVQVKLDAEWVRIKADHKNNITEWKLTCANLQKDGIPKKNFPKAPTQP